MLNDHFRDEDVGEVVGSNDTHRYDEQAYDAEPEYVTEG